jgi:type 1 fimbria pilin
VTADISSLDKGNITLHNENNNDEITANLNVNGTSLAKDLTMDLSSGDNVLNIMATLKSDGNAPAGDYSASTILSVSLQ